MRGTPGVRFWQRNYYERAIREVVMSSNRRQFIKAFGVTLASLIVTGRLTGCTSPSADQDDGFQHHAWEQLRRCWLDLSGLNEAVQGGNWGEDIEARLSELEASHRAVLETLVAADELDSQVAAQMGLAFDEAVYHVSRSMLLCYIIMPFEARVRGDLFKQAGLLQEVASDLDPVTVEQARAAIARDVTFFEAINIPGIDRQRLEQQFGAGRLGASPEAFEAARILVELLLEPGE